MKKNRRAKGKKEPKLLRKKHWFIQDWGTYRTQTPVFIGYTPAEAHRILQKQVKSGKVRQSIVDEFNHLKEVKELDADGACHFSDSGHSLMFMKDYKNDWRHADILVHECFHLVIEHLKDRNFISIEDDEVAVEHEGMAYQHQYLWSEIRDKLIEAYYGKSGRN